MIKYLKRFALSLILKLVVALLLYILVPVFIVLRHRIWVEPAAFDFVYLVPVYVIFIGFTVFQIQNNRLFLHNLSSSKVVVGISARQLSSLIKYKPFPHRNIFWHKIRSWSVILHTAGGQFRSRWVILQY
jgi:putative membrane protein